MIAEYLIIFRGSLIVIFDNLSDCSCMFCVFDPIPDSTAHFPLWISRQTCWLELLVSELKHLDSNRDVESRAQLERSRDTETFLSASGF